MPDASTDYTVDELIVSLIARDIRDHELVQQGGGTLLGSVAVMLARRTHAPNLTYNYLTSIDPIVTRVGNPEDSPQVVSQTALAPFDIADMVSLCLRGKTEVFSTMPAQIDKYGNVNASLIGDDQQRPRVRFPGGLGIPDWTLYAGRVNVYVPKHTRRVFVEKVDYVTGLGHFPGGFAERVRRGVPGRGPQKVFSNLASDGLRRGDGAHATRQPARGRAPGGRAGEHELRVADPGAHPGDAAADGGGGRPDPQRDRPEGAAQAALLGGAG